MNSTEAGDKFRDVVYALLSSAGYVVEREKRVGSKKADLYYEERRRGKTWKVAVETKAYNHALRRSDLVRIYSEYQDAVQENAVNEVLVVSLEPITAADANGYLSKMPTISHRSLAELQIDLLDLDPILSFFRRKHEQEGLEEYYVRPLATGGEDMVDLVAEWLGNEDYSPIAIIAGYGMGKTSLARHITYELARKIGDGDRQLRIPVLINLGGISREQGIEGLIGTALTGSQPTAKGYAFPLFDLLNSAGRFVIILDGFDEMKHMMTVEEFRATFVEINRLVNQRAKVMILGRPTAFLSEHEHAFVLRGVRNVGRQILNMADMPKYRELRLQPFTPEQVRGFLTEYFRYHHNQDFSARRMSELESSQNDELLSRPVHAKMFAELATDANFSVGQLTRFDLYDHFVTLLIEREKAKPGRGTILKDIDRREFSCDLAWHLWIQPTGAALGCRADELPSSLFVRYLPPSEDPNSLRRALLSGSFLDEKAAGVFFFAHRSFQEFLVSEYIYSNLADDEEGRAIIAAFPHALTQEVYDFIIERDDDEFFDTLLSVLGRMSASLPQHTFEVLVSSEAFGRFAAGRVGGAFSSWAASVWIARIFLHEHYQSEDILQAAQQIGVRAANKPGVLVSALRTLLLVSTCSLQEQAVSAKFAIRLMFARPQQDIEALSVESLRSKRSKAHILQDAVFEAVSAEFEAGELMMSLDCSALWDLVDGPEQPIRLDGARGIEVTYRAPFDNFFEHIPAKPRKKLREFFENDAVVANRTQMKARM